MTPLSHPDGRFRELEAAFEAVYYQRETCRACNKPSYEGPTKGPRTHYAGCPIPDLECALDRLLAAVPVDEAAPPKEKKHGHLVALPSDSVRRSDVAHDSGNSVVLLAALELLRQKKFPLIRHGHSTCAADPEVVAWKDVESVLAASPGPVAGAVPAPDLRAEIAAYEQFVAAVRIPASGPQTIHNITRALSDLAIALDPPRSEQDETREQL